MATEDRKTARGSVRCAVVTGEDWQGRPKKCDAPKGRHERATKRLAQIIDHPFGGESGADTYLKLPKCGVCGTEVQVGETYREWARRYGSNFIRCATCPAPTRSMLTGSEIKAAAYEIADLDLMGELDDDIAESSTEEWQEALNDLARELASRIESEVIDLIQEKLDNIEEGMGHTEAPVYYDLQDRQSEVESWQSDVESFDAYGYDDFAYALDDLQGALDGCPE